MTIVLAGLGDRYEIERELGRGGTSIVYLAHDRDRDCTVAIKTVHASQLDDREALARVEREARILSALSHPCIVPLLETRRLEDGRIALVLEHVRGRALKDVIHEDGKLPIRMVVSVMRDIAAALEHAAAHSIVHRDVKPGNIFIEDGTGRARLADFGIARAGQAASTITLTGSALGTPAYMSPEQIDGGPLDGRTDLYSLGMTAYEMLTGRRPWDGDNLYTVIYRQKHDELPPLRHLRPESPPQLLRVIDGLIRKHRVARWGSAAEVSAQLEPLTAGPVQSDPMRITDGAGRVVADDAPTIRFTPPARATASRPAPLHSMVLSEPVLPVRPMVPLRRDRPARRRNIAIAAALILLATASGVTLAMMTGDRQTGNADDEGPVAGIAQPVRESTDSAAPLVPSATPARMATETADTLEGTAGEGLPSVIAVHVEDASGGPVANVRVVFRVVEGDGVVSPTEVITNWRGRAAAAWALGRVPGPNSLVASAPEFPELTVEFTATGTTGAPAGIVILDGDAPAGRASSRTVTFRVEDRYGNPVSGARVDFRAIGPGGSVAPASMSTPASGLARTVWTIGSDSTNRVTAAVAGTDLLLDYTPPRFRLSVRPAVTAGGTHTCVLASGGDARCWGGNDQGQLGAEGMGRLGVGVNATSPFVRIAAGISHTCALDAGGAASCWGVNTGGQLGTGDRTARSAPAAVRSGALFIELIAGLAHTCALTEARAAVCWGAGSDGQIGDGAGADRPTPTAVAGGRTFRLLTAGWRHTCGVTAQGAAWCWGANGEGQLGDGTVLPRRAPVRVAGEQRWVSLAAGASHTCGVTTDGETYCWGQRGSGGSREPRAVAAPPLTNVVAGAVHTCGLSRTGEAFCWGRNNFGQLGNGDTADSPEPVAVADEMQFTALTASGSHTCGRTPMGQTFCWGYNVEGQLGDGSRTNRLRPVRATAAALR